VVRDVLSERGGSVLFLERKSYSTKLSMFDHLRILIVFKLDTCEFEVAKYVRERICSRVFLRCGFLRMLSSKMQNYS
jgi:hypothetical protein